MVSPNSLVDTVALKCLYTVPLELPTFSRPVNQGVSTDHLFGKDQRRHLCTVKQIETQVAEPEQTKYRIRADNGGVSAFPDAEVGIATSKQHTFTRIRSVTLRM